MKVKLLIVTLFVLTALGIAVYTQINFFIVPPIGAVPDGKTVIINNLEKTHFIDNPDAICERETGSVSPACRGGTMIGVKESSDLFIRLPYSEWLYWLSTN